MRAVLAILLVSSAALAEPDRANLYQPMEPEVVGYPNYVLTPRGYKLWQEDLARRFAESEARRVEILKLQKTTVELAAKPELTWRGALLFVGTGAALALGGYFGGRAAGWWR